MLKQKCVYWFPSTRYDNFGRPVVNDPVELSCRWEDITEEAVDNNGTVFLSRSTVYLSADVVPGGVILLGSMDTLGVEDSDFPSDPKTAGALEIRSFSQMPDRKAQKFLRTARL